MARNTDRRDSAPQWKYDRRRNARATTRLASFRRRLNAATTPEAVIFHRGLAANTAAKIEAGVNYV